MAKLESKNNNNLCCYLSNKYDHYFTVKGPLDTDKLAGCTVYPSLGVLYEAMASVSSMSIGIYTSKPKYSRPNSLYVLISSKE